MRSIRQTAVISLIVQLVCAASNVWGLRLRVRPEAKIFQTLLLIELCVQIVEFCAYSFLTFLFFDGSVSPYTIMLVRYVDWSITTPIMLITLMIYLSGETTVRGFLQKYSRLTATVVMLDLSMVGLGWMHEWRSTTPPQKGSENHRFVVYGFVPFLSMFGLIYRSFIDPIRADREKQFMVAWFFTLWTLYGIAAFFSFTARNISYNILDIFSKNITGIFLVWKLSQMRNVLEH